VAGRISDKIKIVRIDLTASQMRLVSAGAKYQSSPQAVQTDKTACTDSLHLIYHRSINTILYSHYTSGLHCWVTPLVPPSRQSLYYKWTRHALGLSCTQVASPPIACTMWNMDTCKQTDRMGD